MKKLALLAGIALAAPAFAQGATSPASAPTAAPSTIPAAEAAAPAPESAPAQAAPADPASILKTEFPNYDKDASGALDKAELTTWLTALQEAQPSKTPLTPEQKTAWLNKSFTDADKDKNGTVNLAELTQHLIPAA